MAAAAAAKASLKADDWLVDLDSEGMADSIPHLPTGSMVMDYLIGGKPNSKGIPPCPGLPRGRIINLYGHEGSGKTTLALETAAQTIRDGGTVLYIDWENEIVPGYAKALGIPIDDKTKFHLVQPETLEQGLSILWTYASAGVSLIVLDSVGAGVPKAYSEKSIKETGDQQRVGAVASAWSQFLPKLRTRTQKTKTTILGIAQIRSAINTMGYGESITVQGGKAWKFYSAVRIKLQRVKTEKSQEYSSLSNKAEETVTGAIIKAKLDKCKVAATQGNSENFYIRWGEGIDDIRSIIDIAASYNVVKKAGSWMEWNRPDGEQIRVQGAEKFRAALLKDPAYVRMLQDQIKPHMAMNSSGEESDDDDEVFDDDGLDLSDTDMDTDVQGIINSISAEA